MELFRVFISTGRWYYVLATSDTEAIDAVEVWGVEGTVVGAEFVNASKPIIMGPL